MTKMAGSLTTTSTMNRGWTMAGRTRARTTSGLAVAYIRGSVSLVDGLATPKEMVSRGNHDPDQIRRWTSGPASRLRLYLRPRLPASAAKPPSVSWPRPRSSPTLMAFWAA